MIALPRELNTVNVVVGKIQFRLVRLDNCEDSLGKVANSERVLKAGMNCSSINVIASSKLVQTAKPLELRSIDNPPYEVIKCDQTVH